MNANIYGAATDLFPERVTIIEVGPRDGLQAEAGWVETSDKIAIIEALIAAGVVEFEATSFVSPRAVPQLRDAAEVISGVAKPTGGRIKLSALVPNVRGAVAAADAGVDAMVVFVSASESHNLKNVNRSRGASLEGFAEVAAIAQEAGIPVQAAIATAFGCPFEGEVPVASVVEIASSLRSLGVSQITLGDTTGMATPPLVAERCRAIRAELPGTRISLHFHNTRGIGLVNVYAGLAEGVDIFESSIGGLGGCPFAPRATGNIATEDLVYMLAECGVETGVDLEKLRETAKRMEELVGHELPGQVMKAGPRTRLSALDEAPTARG